MAKPPTDKRGARAKGGRNRPALTLVEGGKGKLESQPSVRAHLHWTPRQLQTLKVTADQGDLLRLGDLVDQMLADDRIKKLVGDICGGVFGCPLSFEETCYTTVGDAEKGEDLRADWARGWPEDELARLVGWLLVLGVAFAKHEGWTESADGTRVLPVFRVWHAKHFRYDWDKRSWIVRDGQGRETPIVAGDGEWVILTLEGEYRPWSNGHWRGLSLWWQLKQYAISDWGVHSEKSSKLVLESELGALAEDRKRLANEIFELAKDAVISLPAGFKLSLIELSASSAVIYKAQIDMAEMGMTLALVGQNLTSMVEGGSYAAANTHERKELRVFRYVAKKIGLGLQEQSISIWADFNYGNRELAPFPRWETDPPEDKGAKVETLGKLGSALVSLQDAGFKLSVDAIEKEYGVKLEQMSADERAALNPTPAEPAGGGGSGTGGSPARPRKPARLAADDAGESTAGALRGQLYTDDVVDAQAAEAAPLLKPFVERLLAAVDGAKDYMSARTAVLAAFADEKDPDQLAQLVEAGIVMANLAGRLAVDEDAGDDSAE